eukprot:1907571-Alexandrium_andersonii.AAC.1
MGGLEIEAVVERLSTRVPVLSLGVFSMAAWAWSRDTGSVSFSDASGSGLPDGSPNTCLLYTSPSPRD